MPNTGEIGQPFGGAVCADDVAGLEGMEHQASAWIEADVTWGGGGASAPTMKRRSPGRTAVGSPSETAAVALTWSVVGAGQGDTDGGLDEARAAILAGPGRTGAVRL